MYRYAICFYPYFSVFIVVCVQSIIIFSFYISESTDESEVDKTHCLNNSVSSGTYSDYSPSQASSGSSNARVKVGSLQPTAKDAVHNSLWGNRCVFRIPSFLFPNAYLQQLIKMKSS